MPADQHIIFIKNARDRINAISPTFCLAKWLQVTVHLGTGKTHSCHHPTAHRIGLDEIAEDVGALHNSRIKRQEREEMMEGKQPSACDYCWRIENSQPDAISDRHLKSASPWALPFIEQAELAARTGADIYPTYLEVNMGTTCNMACLYCSPEFSSKWAEDTKRHGGYKLPSKTLYDPIWMTSAGMDQMKPLPGEEQNPYEKAFDAWFPQVSPHLHTLRLTGGEPLLNKSSFKVMEDLIANPRKQLEFAINTNLCVPDALIDKLIDCLNRMEGKVKSLTVFTSAEAVGAQQEFVRDGMNWNQFQRNVDRVLARTKARVTFMTTINALSVDTFEYFVHYILRLRQYFDPTDTAGRYSRVGLSLNYLRHPEFMSIGVLSLGTRLKFKRDMQAMAANKNLLLYPHEREQMLQIGQWAADCTPAQSADFALDFKAFLLQVKERRGLDHSVVFPGLFARIGI